MSRFEIVRTDAGWHARFRAGNQRVVMCSEVYTRRVAAVRAIEVVAGHIVELDEMGDWMVLRDCTLVDYVPVRDIDERVTP